MRGRYGHGETHAKTLSRKIVAPFRIAGITAGLATKNHSFDYMLGGWSDADRLPTTPETLNAMRTLGAAMKDSIGASTPDGVIPAAYTYFGQFVDHDITFDEDSAPVSHLAEADLKPLSSLANLRNSRTAFVELDSVYFSDLPRDSNDQNKLKVGQMVLLNGEQLPFLRPSGKSDFNDLPRVGRSDDPRLDRAADIGDPRNDENIIVAQLHTAFLKAHNSLVQQGNDFDGARRKLILRYQSVLLDDYLARICDPEVYMKALQEGPSHWIVEKQSDLFMPVEFAYAAYRFGHSMVRTTYNYNLNFEDIGLDTLFSFTALSGQIGPDADTVPDNWIIQWERILDLPTSQNVQNARPVDTQLTNFLFELRNTFGEVEGSGEPPVVAELAPVLAKRNLLRGYLVGLPTGQALASRLGITPLRDQELIDALPTDDLRAAAEPFRHQTPLWFYILAEAGNQANGGAFGKHLGKVGSTILMETFLNLIRHSPVSLLDGSDHSEFRPFSLAKLIELAAEQDR